MEPGHRLHQGSPGCKHCSPEDGSTVAADGPEELSHGFELASSAHLEMPFRWKKPQPIFVNSMSDLFHEDVPVRFIRQSSTSWSATLASVPDIDEAVTSTGESPLSPYLAWKMFGWA